MSKLENCKVCGSEPSLAEYKWDTHTDYSYFCFRCSMDKPPFDPAQKAREKWNDNQSTQPPEASEA